MPALQRAIAFPEMDGVALAITENLNFDVPRRLQIFFEIDRAVIERGFGFASRGVKCVEEIGLATCDFSSRGRRRRPKL